MRRSARGISATAELLV